MANHPKITVTSHVLWPAYVAVFFAAVRAHFKNLDIRKANIVSFERQKTGNVHVFIYWFKFEYK